MKIVYETESGYKVAELTPSLACPTCIAGWEAGRIKSPKDGGDKCVHGAPGTYQAGTVGKRGGWYGIGPRYSRQRMAERLVDQLDLNRMYER